MNIIQTIVVIALCLFLIGCDGSDNSNSPSFKGNWYNQTTDDYLEIKNNNTVFIRECSVNNGYHVISSGEIDGDTLYFGSFAYKLSRESNKLTVSSENSGFIWEYILQLSIPSNCTGDAIEITFISPSSVTEGMLTTFVVNFDYRLVSKENGIVYLGFNKTGPDTFTISDSTFEITQAESGSGSLSAATLPVYYSPPDSFAVIVGISENSSPIPGEFLSRDNMAVTVTQSSALINNNIFMESINPISDGDVCSYYPFWQCNQVRK